MTRMSKLSIVAWVYAATFLLVVVLGYIPGVDDADGKMFGLFKIDPIDDALHLASAAWAAFGAWRGGRAALVFFRWFGAIYLLDGVVGAIAGEGFLDGAIFLPGPGIVDVGTRIAANVPHMALGGIALALGLLAPRKGWA